MDPFAWLRLALLIRSITSATWDEATWPTVRHELARALPMRTVLARGPWWN